MEVVLVAVEAVEEQEPLLVVNVVAVEVAADTVEMAVLEEVVHLVHIL